MFSKSLSVLLLVFCLVQPNESFFGVDGVIGRFAANWANAANNSTQNQTAQSTANFLAWKALQTTNMSVDLMSKINLTVINYKHNLTITYPILSVLADVCISGYQPHLDGLLIDIIDNFTNVCKPNISDAMLIAGNISLASQNLTNAIMNFNNIYVTACSLPAGGDFIGGLLWKLKQPYCFKIVATAVASYVYSMGIVIVDNQNKLNNLIQNVTSFDYAACQATFLKTFQRQLLIPLMAPLQVCFASAFG